MTAPAGWALRLYLAATPLLAPLAPALLRRRLKRGKEDPARMSEKLGQTGARRPSGPLVWLHAVGLGEVMALRGLIDELAAQAPGLSFLVTSTARSSASVFAANLPPRTQHQFLPIDAPRFYRPFFDHWRPDLSVWSEQDLWPGMVVEAARRDIPLALVNGRLNPRAAAARGRAGGLYGDLYARFSLLAAQDAETAAALTRLGAKGPVLTHVSLKAATPPLSVDAAALQAMRRELARRRVWCLASSHDFDEAIALAAHRQIVKSDPRALLIIAPRQPGRGAGIAGAAEKAGLAVSLRASANGPQLPRPGDQVHVADTFGEMGLWYRLCPAVLMGGTFGPVEGHNPWEPARLGAAVLHGPRTANFAADYARLDGEDAALAVADAAALVTALGRDLTAMATRGQALATAGSQDVTILATRLLALMPGRG
ncbi:MAG: 3-deoxy-D-manno-octulosonic acid transferase [Rhodobacteraceae bacterium]|nr:3-deoxy-D-manno-octulosonic acid transferase [Paracoccaceae bacterium]